MCVNVQHVLKLEGLWQNYQVFLNIQSVSQLPLRHTHLCNNVQLTPSADFASALKLLFPLFRQGCSRDPLISSRPYSSPQLSLLPPQTRCLVRQPTGGSPATSASSAAVRCCGHSRRGRADQRDIFFYDCVCPSAPTSSQLKHSISLPWQNNMLITLDFFMLFLSSCFWNVFSPFYLRI